MGEGVKPHLEMNSCVYCMRNFAQKRCAQLFGQKPAHLAAFARPKAAPCELFFLYKFRSKAAFGQQFLYKN